MLHSHAEQNFTTMESEPTHGDSSAYFQSFPIQNNQQLILQGHNCYQGVWVREYNILVSVIKPQNIRPSSWSQTSQSCKRHQIGIRRRRNAWAVQKMSSEVHMAIGLQVCEQNNSISVSEWCASHALIGWKWRLNETTTKLHQVPWHTKVTRKTASLKWQMTIKLLFTRKSRGPKSVSTAC